KSEKGRQPSFNNSFSFVTSGKRVFPSFLIDLIPEKESSLSLNRGKALRERNMDVCRNNYVNCSAKYKLFMKYRSHGMDKETAAKCAKLQEAELAQALVAGDKFSEVAQAYESAMNRRDGP